MHGAVEACDELREDSGEEIPDLLENLVIS